MEHVETLLKTTLSEIERILSTKSVIGEPVTIEGNTIIPLSSIGFGFGAGGGSGREAKTTTREGLGAGTGGAGGIKPIAVVVISKEGVKVEFLKRGGFAGLAKLCEAMADMIEKRKQQQKEA